jgi:hypothetical protein
MVRGFRLNGNGKPEDIGQFIGYTRASLRNIEQSLKRGNEKFDALEKRMRALETHNPNGWRGAVRPGAIGVGGAGALHFAWEIFRAMVPGG